MLEIEIIQSEDKLEKFLSELVPAAQLTWDIANKAYAVDHSAPALEEAEKGCEAVKSSIREIYAFGQTLNKGAPKFCLALTNIWRNLKYIEDTDYDGEYKYNYLGIKPSMTYGKANESFARLVGRLGLSDTAAYAYRDLGYLVDKATGEFYPEFSGYSVSLLIEIIGYNHELRSWIDDYFIKQIAALVPCDTTVAQMRLYRKIMKLWRCWKAPFSDSSSRDYTLDKKPISEVIDIYNELMQEAESRNKLINIVNKTEKSEPPKTDELVGNDILIKSLRKQVQELRETSVPDLGKCDGCIYKDTNLNKCRCCRRYSKLKDLFKSE